MRLHTSVVEKLVKMFETYGGHRNESRLKEMLSKLDLSTYKRQSGEDILVSSDELAAAQEEQPQR